MGKRDRRKCLPHIAFIKILVVVTARNWGQVDEEMGFCIIRIQEYLKDSKHKDVAGHWMQTRTRGTYQTREVTFLQLCFCFILLSSSKSGFPCVLRSMAANGLTQQLPSFSSFQGISRMRPDSEFS